MTNTEQHNRMMVDWAAPVLKMHGCTLHAHADGWDVELRDGSWRAANSSRELAQLAVQVQAAAVLSTSAARRSSWPVTRNDVCEPLGTSARAARLRGYQPLRLWITATWETFPAKPTRFHRAHPPCPYVGWL